MSDTPGSCPSPYLSSPLLPTTPRPSPIHFILVTSSYLFPSLTPFSNLTHNILRLHHLFFFLSYFLTLSYATLTLFPHSIGTAIKVESEIYLYRTKSGKYNTRKTPPPITQKRNETQEDTGPGSRKDDEVKNNPRKVFSTSLDQIWIELASSGKTVRD